MAGRVATKSRGPLSELEAAREQLRYVTAQWNAAEEAKVEFARHLRRVSDQASRLRAENEELVEALERARKHP